MADDKKDKKVSTPTIFTKSHYQETFIMLLVLLLIGGMVNRLIYYFRNVDSFGLYTLWNSFVLWFIRFWPVWKIFALLIIIGFLAWAAYNLFALNWIEEEEKMIYGSGSEDTFLESESKPNVKDNEKWSQVVAHTNSISPSDWRLAIIEADVMLDELLRACGYHGESIGEMLKSVEPSDFLTLDAAWEAHKVRNRIAHSGADFELNERETKRIIALFESVFKEFEII